MRAFAPKHPGQGGPPAVEPSRARFAPRGWAAGPPARQIPPEVSAAPDTLIQPGGRKGGWQPKPGKFEKQQHKWERRKLEQAAKHQQRVIENPRPSLSSSRGGPPLNPWLTVLLLSLIIGGAAADMNQRLQQGEGGPDGGGPQRLRGGGGEGGHQGGAITTYSNSTIIDSLEGSSGLTPVSSPWTFRPGNWSILPRDTGGRDLGPSIGSERLTPDVLPSIQSPEQTPSGRAPARISDRKKIEQAISGKTGDLLEEQVALVLDRFFSQGALQPEVESPEKLASYIRRIYGKKVEGELEAPSFARAPVREVKKAIGDRLASPVWAKLDKAGVLRKYEGEEPRLLQVISEIETHLHRRGYYEKDRTIQDPARWIDGAMQGRPFESTPSINTEGQLVWGQGAPQEKPVPEDLKPVKDTEVGELFARLQGEVPHADARDGCFARADFSAYTMQVLRGLKGVGKIRIEVKSGKFDLSPRQEIFLDAAVGQKWQMHTAATLTTEEGQTYVMDVALQKPLSADEWIDALGVERAGLTVSNTTKWNYDLKEGKENGVSLIDVLSQTRGLYLSEVLGAAESGEPERWDTWEDSMTFLPVEQRPRAKTYVLQAQNQKSMKSGLFGGREVGPSENVDLESHYRLDFEEEQLTLLVPKGVGEKGIRNTGISGLKVSKEAINAQLKKKRSEQ